MDPLGQLIAWSADYGLAGVFLVTFAERIIPIAPSYALLVAIGIGSASGAWFAPAALALTIAGSYIGASIYYFFATWVGPDRALRFLTRFALLFGASPARIESLIAYFRKNQSTLAFTAQLVPTLRLVAPAIAGLLRVDPARFALASGAGVVLWNGLFFAVGYICAVLAVADNVSELALQVLVVVIVVETGSVYLWHRWRRRGTSADPH